MSRKTVCKLRLENDPRDYGSNNINQILQSLVKRKPKWHRQCYQYITNQNKLDRSLSNHPIECVSETESEVKGAFKLQDKCLYSGNTLYTISFKYNTIILFETNYLMIMLQHIVINIA